MSDISVLVASCDQYSDLWRPFFSLFRRFWADVPYEVYLGSNYLAFNEPGVRTITVGEDKNWSHGLKRMVEKVDSEYIIFMMIHDIFGDAILIVCLELFANKWKTNENNKQNPRMIWDEPGSLWRFF